MFWLIREGAAVHAALDRRVEALRLSFTGFSHGLLSAALSGQEQSELTVAVYDRAPAGARERPLFGWERRWFEVALPKPPARVLLGAAGAGREAAWLVAAGYQVDAFEPAPRAAARLARVLPDPQRTAVGSYEELVAAVLSGQPTALAVFAQRRYDAVVLGWGSFTHVLDAQMRQDLIVACDVVCPVGPILTSFWFAEDASERGRGLGRAFAAGRAVGERVARARGLPHEPRDGLLYKTHAGFAHVFTRDELLALAAGVGRSIVIDTSGYSHATLTRGSARAIINTPGAPGAPNACN